MGKFHAFVLVSSCLRDNDRLIVYGSDTFLLIKYISKKPPRASIFFDCLGDLRKLL